MNTNTNLNEFVKHKAETNIIGTYVIMAIFFLMAIVMIVFAIIERNLTHTRCISKNNETNETNEKCNSKPNDQCKDDNNCKLIVEKDHSVTIGLSIGGIVSLAIGISLIFLVKHFKNHKNNYNLKKS